MNLFARALGGWIGDQCGNRWGLSGRVKWLFVALFGEGMGLMMFSQATTLSLAIPLMITFALFVKMSNGATYAVVPFINRKALGSVSGIVGAGGNAGAVAAGFLFKTEGLDWHTALFICRAPRLRPPRSWRSPSHLSRKLNVNLSEELEPHVSQVPNRSNLPEPPRNTLGINACSRHPQIDRNSELSSSSATAWSGSAFASDWSSSTREREWKIVTFCEEPRAAYDRVGLTSFFAHRDAEKLMLARQEWYAENGVELHLGDRAGSIDRRQRLVRSEKGVEIVYDRVVLATGSFPFVPPVPGIDKQGVFVYRTIEDLQHIIDYAGRSQRCAVIGGGLLGLEAAKAAYDLGLETHVVEFAPRLMPGKSTMPARASWCGRLNRWACKCIWANRPRKFTAMAASSEWNSTTARRSMST